MRPLRIGSYSRNAGSCRSAYADRVSRPSLAHEAKLAARAEQHARNSRRVRPIASSEGLRMASSLRDRQRGEIDAAQNGLESRVRSNDVHGGLDVQIVQVSRVLGDGAIELLERRIPHVQVGVRGG